MLENTGVGQDSRVGEDLRRKTLELRRILELGRPYMCVFVCVPYVVCRMWCAVGRILELGRPSMWCAVCGVPYVWCAVYGVCLCLVCRTCGVPYMWCALYVVEVMWR